MARVNPDSAGYGSDNGGGGDDDDDEEDAGLDQQLERDLIEPDDDAWKDEFELYFSEHDQGQKGFVSSDELTALLAFLGHDLQEDAQLRRRVAQLGEKGMTFAQFMGMLDELSSKGPELPSREDLLRAFQAFDPEKSGFIPDHELRNVMRSLGEKMSREEAEELVFLSPGRGFIDYAQFVDTFLGSSR
jgi:calmodulin